MAIPNPEFAEKSGIALIIPTRNRPDLLSRLLVNLEELTVKPDVVIIVDSSDSENFRELRSEIIRIRQIMTEYKSAAVQRNIGLDYLRNHNIAKNLHFISFLDDDVLVPIEYFELVLKDFAQIKDCVGISGIAKTTEYTRTRIKRSWLTDWIGITGNPGILTDAAVNISPIGLKEKAEVDWLIGCSTWKIETLENLRFESDFFGHSVFEDVIFSTRAGKLGKLVCDPSIVLRHDLAIEGRPLAMEHYANWVINRFRIFSFNVPSLSLYKFWLLTFLLIVSSAAISPFSAYHRSKVSGLVLGVRKLMIYRFYE